MLILALNSYSQSNVTKFLGIPVDGSREKMEKQIEKKGFKKVVIGGENFFTGEFNGQEVILAVKTNKNKVCRITVMDYDYIDENQIKNRFNQLCYQFLNNPKYLLIDDIKMIDREEDIFYEMTVKNKTYEAGFYQIGAQEEIDTILSKYTKEQLNNPSKKLKKEIMKCVLETSKNNVVWFKIVENDRKYGIVIFYENVYNFPTGEDL